ncbi:MAG: helix-turn-helix transcriptional regulator [Pseudomonadota bacterium]
MAIVVRLDVALAKRKMTSRELALQVGISEQNLSILRSGRARGVRFNTLDAICRILGCQPGELLEYMPDAEDHPEDLVVNG